MPLFYLSKKEYNAILNVVYRGNAVNLEKQPDFLSVYADMCCM